MAHTVIRLDRVDSTNSYIRQFSEDGLVVIADSQTAGRGRQGRSFQSEAGKGIYLSMLLKKTGLKLAQAFSLTPVAAQAVADAIEGVTGVRPGIKWINDLILDERKLCGILTELVLTPEGGVESIILGIGVNVTHTQTEFDEEIRDKAISLAMATGQSWDREALIDAILTALDARLEDWLMGKVDLDGYRRDCVTLGREVRVIRGSKCESAYAETIDDSFALVVRFADGRREHLSSGEVSIRGAHGYI